METLIELPQMYLLQVWFNLSDEGTEDAIYDSYAMRKFVGINFLEENAPDATTLLKFRRLLEAHGLNKLFFDAINRVMVETGHMLKGGTVVDATIINASPSTKNTRKQRDPEMHQTKKGKRMAVRHEVPHWSDFHRLPHQPPPQQSTEGVRQVIGLGSDDRTREVISPLQGRASFPHGQMPVRLSEDGI